MKYCPQCGYQTTDENVFCHRCGGRLSAQPAAGGAAGQGAQGQTAQGQGTRRQSAPGQPGAYYPPPNQPSDGADTVRYVQIDTRTGRIADLSAAGKGRGSLAFVQGVIIALTAIAVVIVMVAGSLFLSGQLREKAEAGEDRIISLLPSVSSEPQTEVSSQPQTEVSSEVSSEMSSEEPAVSSEEENPVPVELRAETLRKKIKGSWTTKLPYKSMMLPVTFTFDDSGKASCVIKALFITKQFDGTYTIEDGGACSITLIGMDEYMKEGDTLSGTISFVSDDRFTFTFGSDVLTLDRVK